MNSIWDKLEIKAAATKRQRHTLHKLRRSAYVPKVSKELAAEAIEIELRIIAELEQNENDKNA